MKRVALAALVLVAVFAAAQSGAAKAGGVLAVVGLDSTARLGYLDPATLKLVGKSTQVGYYTWPGARSPDGTRIALARNYVWSGVRIVDVRRMRTVKAFRLTDSISALRWVAPRRILAASEGLSVFAFDPVTGRRLWTRYLPTFAEAVARSAQGFVFLSPPADDYQNPVGPSTLTTVSASGVVRSVALARIVTGSREPDENNPTGTQRFAGLAVDVTGNHAFVVGAGEPIAEVDLATLAVEYHGRTRTPAKLLNGPSRQATWLPNGTIAVTGYDGRVSNSDESATPAGLTIVDPRDWSSRTVDPNATSVAVSGNTLVTYSWFASTGLGVYGLDGSARLHALDGQVENVQLGGGMAFATASVANELQLSVVDLGSGRLVSTRRSDRANILLVP
jgi:hypothetical protein